MAANDFMPGEIIPLLPGIEHYLCLADNEFSKIITGDKLLCLKRLDYSADKAFSKSCFIGKFPLCPRPARLIKQMSGDPGTFRSKGIFIAARGSEFVLFAADIEAKTGSSDIGIAGKIQPGNTRFGTFPAAGFSHEWGCQQPNL